MWAATDEEILEHYMLPLVPGNRGQRQPGNRAGSPFTSNQPPSVAAGHHTAILQRGIQRQGAKRQRRQVGGTKFDGRPGNAGAPQTELLQIAVKEGQNVCAFAPLRLCVEKSIYLQADQRVGQWSDVVSIPVAG